MSRTKEYNIKWYNRLRFRVLIFFVILSLFLILVTSSIISVVSERMTQYIAHEQLSHSRQKVLTELHKRTKMAAAVVDSLSTVALKLSSDPMTLERLAPSLIDHRDTQHLIAGGGIWPEPYAFDKNKVLNSHFWGRNKSGTLEFYDDYNDPNGSGYHNEEWYVPARYLANNKLYWSKSYTDPHSLQSMVTVTAPILRGAEYLGAATIDLKLEGLQELLQQSTQIFNGYAFAIDRNGRLLSFPETAFMSKDSTASLEGSELPSLTLMDISRQYPSFSLFEKHFVEESKKASMQSEDITTLAKTLSEQSYQVEISEAYKIANSLLNIEGSSSKDSFFYDDYSNIFTINNDYLLGQSALAVITKMPSTGWRIVTVMPESFARKSSSQLIATLNISIAICMLVAIILVWLLLKRNYVDPLEDLTGQLKSSIYGLSHEQHQISTNDKGELGGLAYWFNQRTNELLSSKEEVKSLALYDPLTGLPNRRMLHTHLDQALLNVKLSGTSGSVMFLDLDHFKNLNDSLGHDVGDQLLMAVSKRISACLRRDDMVARIGGDEFVIVLSGYALKDKDDIPKMVADKILKSLIAPFFLAGSDYHVTASIGIEIFDSDNLSTKNILKHADAAMYNSKSLGRNAFCFFEDSMQVQADHRLRIEKDLRNAITHNQLFLAYQPQIYHHDECHSVEALIRWQHPEKGFIPPIEFIAIAEESMLILSLGDWVIENVCEQIKAWEDKGIFLNHVSINISPIQFKQIDFVDKIIQIINKYRVSPSRIMVEITEGVIIDNPESIIEKILQLKKFGIRVSVDDFGTGYSSLTYLKQLPLDELKIDRSFIQEIENDHSDVVITETIITMAKNFGYDVIAEGVETERQKDILMSKGCYAFQGYLFSKPLPPEDIPEFIQTSRGYIGHISSDSHTSHHSPRQP